MKAISLWQPWATAIPLGIKRLETRGWSTRYRGPLAIHAAKHWDKDQDLFARSMRQLTEPQLPDEFPFGAVVGVAWLVDVIPSERARKIVNLIEAAFGDYAPGRFAWVLEDAQPLTRPLPWKGKQGFFNVPVELLNPLVPDWFAKRAA